MDKEQVNEQAESTQQDTLSEDEQIEKVGQLLREEPVEDSQEEPEESQNEIQNESQNETESQEETSQDETEETSEQATPVIDDELIEKFPTLKMYRGKPLSDLATAYDNIVRKATTVSQELKKLREKTAQDELPKADDAPDPVDNPEEFKKWYENKVKTAYEQGLKSQTPTPQYDLQTALKDRLPDVDVNKVAQEYANYYAPRFYDEYGNIRQDVQKFYNENPEVLVNEIEGFYQLKSKADKDEYQIRKEAKQQANGQLRDSFKKANKHKESNPSTQANVASRSSKLSPEEELLLRIQENIGITQEQ